MKITKLSQEVSSRDDAGSWKLVAEVKKLCDTQQW
jgi:hypothetical protein